MGEGSHRKGKFLLLVGVIFENASRRNTGGIETRPEPRRKGKTISENERNRIYVSWPVSREFREQPRCKSDRIGLCANKMFHLT